MATINFPSSPNPNDLYAFGGKTWLYNGNAWQLQAPVIYTANVVESASNLYYTNARVYANVIAFLPTYTGNLQVGNIITSGGSARITGADFISTNTLVTNTLIINGYELFSNNDIVVNRITANIWTNLYTTNVIEQGSNVFYSNARVYANVLALLPTLAGTGISIAANGQISSTGAALTPNSVTSVELAPNSVYSGAIQYNAVTTNKIAPNAITAITIASDAVYGNAIQSNAIDARTIRANAITAVSLAENAVTNDKIAPNAITAAKIAALEYLRVTGNVTSGNSIVLGTLTTNNLIVNGTEFFSNNDIIVNRITANVWTNLYTANVIETAGNIFYSNDRVRANVIALLPTLAGNNIIISANGQISATNTGNINVENINGNVTLNGNLNVTYGVLANTIGVRGNGAPIISSTSNITLAPSDTLFITNKTIIAGNLTVTGTFVTTSNLVLNSVTTNVLTTNNLIVNGYELFSNNDVNVNKITANIWTNLFTGNVIESATNLFYTNARVRSNVIALLPTLAGTGISIAANGQISSTGTALTPNSVTSVELAANSVTAAKIQPLQYLTVTGNVTSGNIRVLGTLTTNNLIVNGYELFSNNDVVVNRITANIWTNLYTTNVIEFGSNIFYSNDRVRANVIALLPTLAGTGISIAANGQISSTGGAALTADSVTTDKIAANAVTAAKIAPLEYLRVNGNTTSGNVIVLGTLTTNNLIVNGYELFSNNDVIVNRITANIWTNLYTNNIIETAGNIFYSNARVYANVLALLPTYTGNLQVGNIITSGGSGRITGADFIQTNTLVTNTLTINGYELFSNNDIVVNRITANVWTNLYTANVIETAGNIFYSNDRVRTNVIALLPTLAGPGIAIAANGQISSTTSIGSIAGLNTANVSESASNLYYTNARVYANVLALLPTYTGNLQVGNIITSGGTGRITGADFIQTNTLVTNTLIINGYELFSNNDVVVNRITANIWTNLYASNVIENGSTTTGNVFFTNTRAINAFTPGTGIAISGSGVISSTLTGTVSANTVAGLTTSNISEGANLYYTNNRVYANVITLMPTLAGNNIVIAANGQISATITSAAPSVFATSIIGLTTANVAEAASNLYYTNARVYANVLALLPTYTGNLQVGNIITSGGAGRITGADFISTNTLVTNTLVINGYELFSNNDIIVNRITANIWTNLYTANVIESASNLYYTNARVYANVIGLLNAKANTVDLTTANVIESASNLYYTNARVYANVIGLLNAKANVIDLTTSNVVEGNNLYYTNARVRANTIELLPTLAGPGITIAANGQISATTSAGSVTGLNTANVAESASNLYYTNARVYANVISLLPNYTGNLQAGNAIIGAGAGGSITGANLISANNISATNWIGLYTANVIESASNLYYTDARVYANVIGLLNAKANVVDLTTANVIESASNLYFTNTRARAAISAGTGVSYDDITGVISIGQNVNTTADVTFNTMTVTGNLNVLGNLVGFYANTLIVNDPLIQLGHNNPSDALDLGFIGHYNDGTERHAGLFRDATDTKFKFFDNYNVEPGAGTIDTANTSFRLANVVATTFEGNVIGNVTGYVSSISNFTTSNLDEGTNLYFNNSRATLAAVPAVTQLTVSTPVFNYNIDQYVGDNPAIYATAGETISFDLNIGASHPFYIRVSNGGSNYNTGLTHVATNGTVSTGASAQGKVTGKLFWKVPYSLAGSTYVYQCGNHSSMVGNIVIQKPVSTITTSDIAEGSNLYYSNDRVRANVIALLPTLAGTGINIEANGQISSTTSVGSIAGLNTANVSESASNLYYTNARVYANVISLLDAKANVVDLTTANVSESASNLYYTNARVYSNVVSLLSGYTGDINAGNITTSTIIANSIIGTALGGSVTGANLISTNNISSLNWIGLYTANVAEFGNTTTGNVFFTNTRAIGAFSAGSGISISANGLISSTATGVVTANSIVGLNTSNIAEGSNLYYTNARVYANVIGLLNAKANVVDLTTANVNEFGSNLYYTNARVYANVIALLPTYTGNVTAGNVTTTTLYANSIIGSAVGGYITGANLISANNISSLNWIGLYTANVVETSGNLYFTNARVVSNVIALLPSLAGSGISIDTNGVISASLGGVVFANTVIGLTTANVSESASNLYYTNARVYANVIGVINALTTANVAESTSNLYYTNTRVYGNVIALLPTYTGNVNAGNVTTTTLYANSIVGAAVGGYITGANLISTNNISSLNWIGLYTANVIESASNLYFTNSRVYANVTNILQSLNTNIVPLVDSIYDLGSSTRRFRDLYLSGSTLRIGNISLSQGANGGLAITSSAGNLAILSDTISANSWVGLYSSNVVESSTNLFYSNARVYSNVIAVLSTLAGNGIAIDANGVISSTLTGTVSANTVRDLTTSNIAEGSNLYYTNVRVYSNVVSMLSGYTGNINAGNITTSILIANSIVGTALGGSITGANLISTNNISSFNWIGLYTANAIESASNLYYTNARVFAALSSGTGVDYSNTTGVISIGQNVSPNASVTFANLTVTGTASFYGNVTTYSSNNLSISDNMIYLNNGSTTSNPDLGFAGNYNDGSYKHTGFFRDATDGTWKVFDNYSPEPDASQFIDTAHASFRLANLSATTVTANIVGTTGSFTGNISAGNVIATGSITANGLIIRGINVTDSVLAGNITANTSTSDTVTANTITANIWNNLYTANVVETAGNLYFTNTRVVAALVAGDNITIESNGRISSSGGGGGLTQLTVSSSQTLTGGNKNYTLSSSVNNANSIIVSINGMVQAPAIDYTLNGGQGLQFSANTTANALIEVKYYGYSALSPNVAVVSSSVTIPTVAGQTAYMMGANVTQAQSIMVALDGLIQRPTVDYTVNNTTITMIPAPPEGSNIEIRFFGQEAVALAGAQYTTAYISNSRTYAGGSANLNLGSNVLLARNIIVNIDGVTQIPDLNYTVSGSTLSFGTSVPAIGSLVEVKFFGAEAFNANLTQAMVTAVLPTVLSNDTLVRQIIRSSAYAFSRIFY